MALKLRYIFLLALVSSASVIYGCQAETPALKKSSTQNLLAQVEAIEADEATLLFQQAKVAAEKDNVKEAQSLIQQALGRGAGSTGMYAAKAEIKKAEARIAERKRKDEDARRAREAEKTSSIAATNTSSLSTKNTRVIGVREIQAINVGGGYSDTYNAYCNDGTYTTVTVNVHWNTPNICSSNRYKSSLCKSSTDWSIRDAAEYGCGK